jgi:hypothetical protein
MVTMTELEILNHLDAKFSFGEKMHGKIRIDSERELDNLMLNFAIRNISGVSVTAARTDPTIVFHRGENVIDFTIDISSIVPGIYTLNPHMSTLNSFGSRTVLDMLVEAYTFEIISTEEFQKTGTWEPVWCGYYKGPKIEYRVEG